MFIKLFFTCYIVLLYEQVLSLDPHFENAVDVTDKNPKGLFKKNVVHLLAENNTTEQMKLFYQIVNQTTRNGDIIMHIHTEVESSPPYFSKRREEYQKTLYKASIATLSLIIILLTIAIVVRPCTEKNTMKNSMSRAANLKNNSSNHSVKVEPDYKKVWLQYENNPYHDEPKKKNLESFQSDPCRKTPSCHWLIKRIFGNALRSSKVLFYDHSMQKNSKDTQSLIKDIESSSVNQPMRENPNLSNTWFTFRRNSPFDQSALRNSEDGKNSITGIENPTCGLCISQSNGNFITCPKVPFPGQSILGDSDVEIIIVDPKNPSHDHSIDEVKKDTENLIPCPKDSFQDQSMQDHAKTRVLFPMDPYSPSAKKESEDINNSVEGNQNPSFGLYISQENEANQKVILPGQSTMRESEDSEIIRANHGNLFQGQSIRDITENTDNLIPCLEKTRCKSVKENSENAKTWTMFQKNTPDHEKDNCVGNKNLVEDDEKSTWGFCVPQGNGNLIPCPKEESPGDIGIVVVNENNSFRDQSAEQTSKCSEILMAYLESLEQAQDVSEDSEPYLRNSSRDSIVEITENKEKIIAFLMSPFPGLSFKEKEKESTRLMVYLENLQQARDMSKDSNTHMRNASRDSIVEINGNNEKLFSFLMSPFSAQSKDENWENIKRFNDF